MQVRVLANCCLTITLTAFVFRNPHAAWAMLMQREGCCCLAV